MLPHQGVVSLVVSIITITITLSVMIGILRLEKRHQADDQDEH